MQSQQILKMSSSSPNAVTQASVPLVDGIVNHVLLQSGPDLNQSLTQLVHLLHFFTARCTLVQSAVLQSHVVCPSVTLVNCNHIGWNSSKIISPLVSLGRSLFATPTWRVCSKGNTPKFGPKVTHPLLIWALESFHCKLRPNGYT